jgi:hypothetical protein
MNLAAGCVLLPGDMMLQREEMVMSKDKRGNIQLWPDHHQTLSFCSFILHGGAWRTMHCRICILCYGTS